MKKALLIIAKDGFQDMELNGTRDGLVNAGFEVVLASSEAGSCLGKLGATEEAEVALKDVNLNDFDRVGFIGGPGAFSLISDSSALNIAHETVRAGKPLGAICIAPLILAKAKVLGGKKATVWDSGGEQQHELEKYDAIYTGQDITVDGKIVTANGPASAEEFGRTLASL
ncbi:MAG: DJ-1/PfpI family protein [Candidatus Peribacteraceae bacterium]|jgi:protease I|nr:DJ-1/PfpI family protein [Candidatus Peribacteraceae bacterium]HCI03843.1 DJ-1 family protein [Candidatus Peribacteria bacterium]|tara:strand:+ start:4929 stop:5438 length:510 start_codon:yes stop_codon:yes gene_type:complete